MDKISALIPRVLASRGLKDQAGASYAVYLAIDWLHSFSVDLAQFCIVTTVIDGVLTIECMNSVAMQELSHKSDELRLHLNSFDGISVRTILIIRSRNR